MLLSEGYDRGGLQMRTGPGAGNPQQVRFDEREAERCQLPAQTLKAIWLTADSDSIDVSGLSTPRRDSRNPQGQQHQ